MTGKLNRDGIKEIDPNKVEILAAQGLTTGQIASCFGVSRATLYNRMGSEVDVLDAIKRGRAKGIGTVTNALFQAAKEGNITAQIFYLKNRDPDVWKDRKAVEYSGDIAITQRDMSQDELRLRLTAAGLDPQHVLEDLGSSTVN